MDLKPKLKYFANLYNSIGLNILVIGSKRNTYNSNENNLFKAPNHNYTSKRDSNQSIEEFENLNWENSIGIGAVIGINNLIAIDIDGCYEYKLIQNILILLGLPLDYEWVYKTGNFGYHIILKCKDICIMPTESEMYNSVIAGYSEDEIPFGSNSVNAYFPKESERYFNKIEFIWNGNIVLPPSLHLIGNFYEFINQVPEKEPLEVKFSRLWLVKNEYCSIQANPSDIGNGIFTRQFIAKTDKIQEINRIRRYQNSIVINYEIFEIDNIDSLETIDKYLIRIIWYVIDKNQNIHKRNLINFIKNKDDFKSENIVIDFNLYGLSKEIIFKNNANTNLLKIHSEIVDKIIISKRSALFELLFDIDYSDKVYFENELYFHNLLQDINQAGQYFDSFSKIISYGNYPKEIIYILDSKEKKYSINCLYKNYLKMVNPYLFVNPLEIISLDSLNFKVNNANSFIENIKIKKKKEN